MTKTFLKAGTALQVLAFAGVGVTAGIIAASPAAAQDYTSGAITGTVTDANGAPVPGATVSLTSQAQGLTRTFVTSSNGTFTASGLAPGEYNLTVTANGYSRSEDVISIAAATQSTVTVGLVTQATSQEIVVTGRARQAQTQGATGLNVDVAAVTANVAVPRNLTGIVMLAPTTARGSTFFGDVPQIGGGSVAENAYYINGLNITNPDTYIGSARVPFDFYKTVDVQTGGYPAEFGRATGGVINATTKAGTNIPFIALHVNWQPASLQSHRPNIGLATNPADIGKMNESDLKTASLEAGGAIVPDHLFAYGMIEAHRDKFESASQSAHSFRRQTARDPFWGIKLDGYINPTQHAEFTMFDTRTTITDTAYNFSANSDFSGGTIGTVQGVRKLQQGGLNWVARYTGDVTDWLTLSGAYGINKDDNNILPEDVNSYYVIDDRTGDATVVSLNQPFATNAVVATKRRFYRADADMRVEFAGQHRFRGGFDNEDVSEDKITKYNGALPLLYYYDPTGINITYVRLGGRVSGTNTAYYLQDSWATPVQGLTLNLGMRYDIFKQYNLSGQQYANLKDNWGPRLAFTYTPPSLENWKFFGSFGRYYIPPAMNLGFRGKDLFFDAYFDYPVPGDPSSLVIDPTTGLPTGPVGPIITTLAGQGYGTPCPTTPTAGAPGNPVFAGPYCSVNGADVQDPALAKYALDAKATQEDEFILGTRYKFNRLLSFGLQGTYRKLNRVSEDTDFQDQYINYWCGPGGSLTGAKDATECAFYLSNPAYHIWNPGSSSLLVNDFYQATLGNAVPVTLTGLTFPKPRRTYKAVVFDFNRSDDGRWLAGGSVTWSQLKGNYEGNVRSDVGNGGQRDAGALIDFDYLGLTDYTYGRLFGDHTWVFKAFGAYHFGPMFTLGANVLVQSPGHGSCFGIHPTDPAAASYGSLSNYCGSDPYTLPNGAPAFRTNVPSPRGTGFKTDWLKQLDLSARFNLPFGGAGNRRLTLRADVFNVFNSHAVLNRNASSETSPRSGGGYNASRLFLLPNAYQTPRYVRLGLDLLWGGVAAAPAVVEAAPPPPPPPAPPATQTCADGSVILATDTCPAPPPPPPPPAPVERGERGL